MSAINTLCMLNIVFCGGSCKYAAVHLNGTVQIVVRSLGGGAIPLDYVGISIYSVTYVSLLVITSDEEEPLVIIFLKGSEKESQL